MMKYFTIGTGLNHCTNLEHIAVGRAGRALRPLWSMVATYFLTVELLMFRTSQIIRETENRECFMS